MFSVQGSERDPVAVYKFYAEKRPLMLLNVNTHANTVIESSFALMNLMDVLMNVYLPYSFNC